MTTQIRLIDALDRYLEIVKKGGFQDERMIPEDMKYVRAYLKADENLRKLKKSGQLESYARRVMDARALW